MRQFSYQRPATIDAAVEAAAAPGAAILGAGTNLLDMMKIGVMAPEIIVDITHIPGLDTIETLGDGSLRIGALARNSDVARHPDVAANFPAVSEALLSGASAQLRNAATTGGNLMQRTRCPYFTDTASACNKRAPGTGCDAKEGAAGNFAILGSSDSCIATNPSDFCVSLAAFDAVVEVAGPNGRREIPMETFHLLPGDTPQDETALEEGEIITGVRLPAEAAAFRGNARYLKLRERTSYAFALVSAAAGLKMDGGKIAEARLALGGVAPKPWRATAAEDALKGATPGRAAYEKAADAALADAASSNDNAYKIDLAKRIIVRAFQRAAAGTPDRMPALPASVFAQEPGEMTDA